MKLKIKLLSSAAQLPRYAHPGDSGMDIAAIEDAVIKPGDWAVLPTGLSIELPPGTEAQLRPRSGLAARQAISMLNTPATIDEGYRGELKLILVNLGKEDFIVTPGMRIAQMVICPVFRVEIEESGTLSETPRAAAGFGSTGV